MIGVDQSTLLVIAPIGLPVFAARGIKQTLNPISQATNIRRTVNGKPVSLAPPQFQKYASTITCDDMDSPALDGVWPGLELTIDCVCELCYLTQGGTPQRTVVDGSSRIEGDYTWYRPRLDMMVAGPASITTNEWGAAVSWSIPLEEI